MEVQYRRLKKLRMRNILAQKIATVNQIPGNLLLGLDLVSFRTAEICLTVT